MASQNPSSIYNTADNTTAQAQLKRDELINIPSNTQHYGQDPNFAQQTGDQVKTMAHGAANIATGAAQGAVNIAQGAAVGAANMAQGAAGAVKRTLGVNPADNSSNYINSNTNLPISTNDPNNPATRI